MNRFSISNIRHRVRRLQSASLKTFGYNIDCLLSGSFQCLQRFVINFCADIYVNEYELFNRRVYEIYFVVQCMYLILVGTTDSPFNNTGFVVWSCPVSVTTRCCNKMIRFWSFCWYICGWYKSENEGHIISCLVRN